MTINPNELFQHQQAELQVTHSAVAQGAFVTPLQQQSFLPIKFQEHLQVGWEEYGMGGQDKKDRILSISLVTKSGHQCCEYWI